MQQSKKSTHSTICLIKEKEKEKKDIKNDDDYY